MGNWHAQQRGPVRALAAQPRIRTPPAPRAAAVLGLQRSAGNRATVAMLQRQPENSEPVPEVRRALGTGDTAAVIWKSPDGTIRALVELDGNASLDRYLSGRATIDELVGTGRAVWAQQSVGTLPRPLAPPPAQADPKGDLSHWSARLATLFKQLRTARIVLFKAGRDVLADAAAAEAQLKVLRREARALANRLAKSGGGAKVAARLKAVQADIAAVQGRLDAGKAAVREANALVRGEVAVASGLFGRIRQLLGGGGVARPKAAGVVWRTLWKAVGPAVGKLVNLLERGRAASKLFAAIRKLSSPWVGRTLIAVSAVLDGINAYETSQNRTETGRIADATVTGASGALVVANPLTAIADVVLPKDYKLSTMYRGGSGAVTALGEGLLTGDTSAMESFHEASKRGEYGKVMQLSSEAGDYWAEHGIVGGLKEFGSALADLF